MADAKSDSTTSSKKEAAPTTVFDFGKFEKRLDEQRGLIENRQAVQQQQAKVQEQILHKSNVLAAEYENRVEPVRERLIDRRQKALTARQLADSNNPVDTLRLMGLQASDPNGYLRTQRTARTAEDTQYVSALGQTYNVSQSALQYAALESQGKVNAAKIAESIGLEKLKQIQDEAAILTGNLQAAQTMQAGAIQGLTPEQLQAGIAGAEQNGGQTNINGIDVSGELLKTRLANLQERSFLRKSQEHIRKVKELQIDSNTTDLDIEYQKRIADTMTMEELMGIMKNGYKEGDTQFQSSVIHDAMETQRAIRARQVQDALLDNQLANFDKEDVRQEAARIDVIQSRFTPGTVVARAAQNYKSAIGQLSVAMDTDDEEQRLKNFAVYQSAKDSFNQAMLAEAKADSKGDKGLEEIYAAYYTGQQLPTATITNVLQKRLLDGKSASDLISPQLDITMNRAFKDAYQALLRESMTGLGINDKTELKKQAAQIAVQTAVNQALNGKTDVLVGSQVLDSSHPLAQKGWTPTQFIAAVGVSDKMAYEAWLLASNLSPEEAHAIQSGSSNRADAPQLLAGLKALESRFFLEKLNGMEQGLGTKVAKWWQLHGSDYLDRAVAGLGSNATSLQDSAVAQLSGQQAKDEMLKYGVSLIDADDSIRQHEIQQRAHFLSFGGNPQNTQVMLLHYAKNLEPNERKLLWEKVVYPLVQAAKEKGLNLEDSNAYIESQVMTLDTGDKELDRILKAVRRDRKEVAQQVGDMVKMASFFDIARTIPFTDVMLPVTQTVFGMRRPATDMASGRVGWYTDWLQQQSKQQVN